MKRSAPPRRKARLRTRTVLRRKTTLRRVRRDLNAARATVRDRADGRCEAAVEGVCCGTGRHAHHILLRSQGGPDTPENLLWLCPACHGWIHDHPKAAAERGLLKLRSVA